MTLKEIREQSKLTQSEAAKKTGCTVSFISKIENGHEQPNVKMAVELSNLYKVPVERILRAAGFAPARISYTVYSEKGNELIASIGTDDVIVKDGYKVEATADN